PLPRTPPLLNPTEQRAPGLLPGTHSTGTTSRWSWRTCRPDSLPASPRCCWRSMPPKLAHGRLSGYWPYMAAAALAPPPRLLGMKLPRRKRPRPAHMGPPASAPPPELHRNRLQHIPGNEAMSMIHAAGARPAFGVHASASSAPLPRPGPLRHAPSGTTDESA